MTRKPGQELLDRWGCCYWADLGDQADAAIKGPGEVRPGIFFLEPPIPAVTVADGLWAEVNRLCGTLFDLAESDRAQAPQVLDIADAISAFVARRYTKDGIVKVTLGTEYEDGRLRSIVTEVPATQLRVALEGLCAFLRRAAGDSTSVVVTL